ncbi:MAG: DUF4468 domain-containing protein [Bacteroidetes bacterium]|nr:DUF4468 domain-containing protein [Bacteroidota bacterium]
MITFVLSIACLNTFGQESAPPDSSVITDSATTPIEIKSKPYERFKLNVDTITNLVTYKAIVDQSETGADSFYVRAKKWADRKYNLVKNKKIVILDKPNEKLVLKGKFDAYTSFNKYNKSIVGTINFNLTIIFKEDKYKYIIDNITYEPFQDPELVKSGKLKPEMMEGVTYFEYFLTKKFKVRETDNLLKCSDQEFQNLIAEIKKSLKNPTQVDEDDF